jgi:hypothetical protein
VPTLSFKQIAAVEPIPASEKVPVEALNTTNEIETKLSSDLHWWSLPGDEQNFWQISVPSGLFILFSLVMLQFL